MRVLAISGSLRRDSYNTMLVRAAAERAPAGVEIELWDRLKAVPPYDEDDDTERAPAAVAELRQAVADADAVLISTPEYNWSIPGQVKNALDWVSRPPAASPMRNKPVAVIGASTGAFGAVWSQAELRKVLGAMGARVLEDGVAVGQAAEKATDAGELGDESTAEQLDELVADLVDAARERSAAARERAAA